MVAWDQDLRGVQHHHGLEEPLGPLQTVVVDQVLDVGLAELGRRIPRQQIYIGPKIPGEGERVEKIVSECKVVDQKVVSPEETVEENVLQGLLVLIELDGFGQGRDIACAESIGTLALNNLHEEGVFLEHWLREDLDKGPSLVALGCAIRVSFRVQEETQSPERLQVKTGRLDFFPLRFLKRRIGRGRSPKFGPMGGHGGDGLSNVVRGQSHVLKAGTTMLIQEILNSQEAIHSPTFSLRPTSASGREVTASQYHRIALESSKGLEGSKVHVPLTFGAFDPLRAKQNGCTRFRGPLENAGHIVNFQTYVEKRIGSVTWNTQRITGIVTLVLGEQKEGGTTLENHLPRSLRSRTRCILAEAIMMDQLGPNAFEVTHTPLNVQSYALVVCLAFLALAKAKLCDVSILEDVRITLDTFKSMPKDNPCFSDDVVRMGKYLEPANFDIEQAIFNITQGPGYYMIKGAFSEEDIKLARDRVLFYTNPFKDCDLTLSQTEELHNNYKGMNWNLLNKGKIFSKLIQHPTVLKLSRALLGEEVQLSSLASNTVLPGMDGQTPHLDYPYYQYFFPDNKDSLNFPNLLALQFVTLLTDFLPENGGTAFRPDSHKEPTFPHDEQEFFNNAIQVVGSPGDILVFAGPIQHCAMPNKSNFLRSGILQHMAPIYIKPFEMITPSEHLLESASDELKKILAINHPYPIQKY
eukprot:maker-scaffold140_size315649-snap-gene-1.12 protein:Tk03573 transcript:maker-scaffold140_size315649-snap-gene-1.12-mRNA-1 annotation:"phytanoyl- dioxygenase"